MELLTASFALGSSLVFAFAPHVQKRAVEAGEQRTGTFVSILTVATIFWLIAPFVLEGAWWSTRAALLFALCGLLFPAVSQRMQIAAVHHVGPSLTSAIGSFWLIFAVVPAVLFLGEQMNGQGVVGTALLLAGLVLASVANGGRWRVASAVLLLYPLAAAFARGIVQPVAKIGYAEVQSPIFGTLVMATVSTVVTALFLLARGHRARLPRPTPGHFWYALNGVCIGTGILLLQCAISVGDISIAAPLMATIPVWTILLGAFVFRNEQLGRRHAGVVALIFVGSVLIVTR